MKVGINARLLSSPDTRGWNRYAINLMLELQKLNCELVLYTEFPIHNAHFDRLDQRLLAVRESGPMLYLKWEQMWLPMTMRRDGLDVFHSPFHFGLPFWTSCPRVLTLHDAIGHRNGAKGPFRFAAFLTNIYEWIARSCADQIVTVSEHAKLDLVEQLSMVPEKFTVVHNAADPALAASDPGALEVLRKSHQIGDRFLFYVGGWEVRKNVDFLVKAFARATADDLCLVLAGAKPEEIARVRKLIVELGVSTHVTLLGRISDVELAALYAGCHCFVYPSLAEGFGLQLCEAMLAGAPILSSDATSLPEVLGGGGALFNATDVEELATLIRRVASDEAFRQDLVRRSKQRSLHFGWDRTAAATLQVYEMVATAAQSRAVAT
ncbi:glycosyl transferase family 1 [Bryobacterales bacterium F-183]|nr:glycosyl transferase family 1 [Bryobacterales bacterium F-183]